MSHTAEKPDDGSQMNCGSGSTWWAVGGGASSATCVMGSGRRQGWGVTDRPVHGPGVTW